jgi:hypothetical protein
MYRLHLHHISRSRVKTNPTRSRTNVLPIRERFGVYRDPGSDARAVRQLFPVEVRLCSMFAPLDRICSNLQIGEPKASTWS